LDEGKINNDCVLLPIQYKCICKNTVGIIKEIIIDDNGNFYKTCSCDYDYVCSRLKKVINVIKTCLEVKINLQRLIFVEIVENLSTLF